MKKHNENTESRMKIEEIEKDKKLNEQFDIDVYESYIDGMMNKRW